ncbi:MAG: sigma 54-interacting transcriptional regulator [Zetaproteobacteria bacterium]|nr:sigma 54-interacting transcriptional regulator [Zetaproteobacteria bacterium]
MSDQALAESSCSIWIEGVPGAGKTYTAEKIAQKRGGVYHIVSCPTLSANPDLALFGSVPGAYTGASSTAKIGLFRKTDGGTLILDDVQSCPIDVQAKLLRVVESGEYSPIGSTKTKKTTVKVVSTFNGDPNSIGIDFRLDLFQRLSNLKVEVKNEYLSTDVLESMIRKICSSDNIDYNKSIYEDCLTKVIEDGVTDPRLMMRSIYPVILGKYWRNKEDMRQDLKSTLDLDTVCSVMICSRTRKSLKSVIKKYGLKTRGAINLLSFLEPDGKIDRIMKGETMENPNLIEKCSEHLEKIYGIPPTDIKIHFRRFLKKENVSQGGFATIVGLSRVTVGSWARENSPYPQWFRVGRAIKKYEEINSKN